MNKRRVWIVLGAVLVVTLSAFFVLDAFYRAVPFAFMKGATMDGFMVTYYSDAPASAYATRFYLLDKPLADAVSEASNELSPTDGWTRKSFSDDGGEFFTKGDVSVGILPIDHSEGSVTVVYARPPSDLDRVSGCFVHHVPLRMHSWE